MYLVSNNGAYFGTVVRKSETLGYRYVLWITNSDQGVGTYRVIKDRDRKFEFNEDVLVELMKKNGFKGKRLADLRQLRNLRREQDRFKEILIF